MTTLAIELEVLGDTRQLWRDWLDDASRVLDVEGLPEDRAAAAAELDARGAGNWRTLLERYAEDRAPVYLRPAAEVSAALRGLQAEGVRLAVFTDAPAELARVALSQLGAARRVDTRRGRRGRTRAPRRRRHGRPQPGGAPGTARAVNLPPWTRKRCPTGSSRPCWSGSTGSRTSSRGSTGTPRTPRASS